MPSTLTRACRNLGSQTSSFNRRTRHAEIFLPKSVKHVRAILFRPTLSPAQFSKGKSVLHRLNKVTHPQGHSHTRPVLLRPSCPPRMPRQKPVVPRIDTSLAQLNAAEPAVLTSTAIAHAAALPTPALPRDTLLPPVPRLDSSTTSAPTSAQIAPPNTADPDVSHQLHPRFDKRLHSASSPLLDINTFLDLLPTPDEERSMSYRRPLRHSPRLHLAPSPFSPRPLFDTLLSRSLRSHVSLTAGPTHVATDVPSEPLETPLLEKTDHEWPLPMGHAPPAPKPVVENTTLPTPPTSIEASRAASPTLTVQPVPLTPYLSMPEEKKPKKGELLKCTVEGCGQVFKRPHNLKSHLRIQYLLCFFSSR